MHPLIARFLDLEVAVEALEKADQAVSLDPEQAALAQVASEHVKSKQAVLKAKGKQTVSPDAQQHLILLTVEAATALVSADPRFASKVTAAVEALKSEGADDDEVHHLIAQAVLEEAFAFAEDPAVFDAPFVAETLEGLVPLSKVDSDAVDEWLEKFSKASDNRALRLKASETLLDAAWSEGPMPISAEHVDDALDSLTREVAASEFVKAAEAMIAFLKFLGDGQRQIIGPLRLERLEHLVRTAIAAGLDLEEEEDEDDEDDDAGRGPDA